MPLLSVPVPRVEEPFLKVTVPVGVPSCEPTVAVNMTLWPKADGFSDEATEVEVGAGLVTRKGALLESATLGLTTSTSPVVAPAGTVARISDSDTTVNVAAVPLKLTPVVPVRLFPRIKTTVPTLPELGNVFTNGPSPTDRLKIVLKVVP